MLRTCRCRHHKPTAGRWLFFSAHQWELEPVGRHGQLNSTRRFRDAQRLAQGEMGRLTQRGTAAKRCEAIPGGAGPTFLGQSRLVSEERRNLPEMPFLGATGEVGEAHNSGELSREGKARQDEFSLSQEPHARNAACPSAKRTRSVTPRHRRLAGHTGRSGLGVRACLESSDADRVPSRNKSWPRYPHD